MFNSGFVEGLKKSADLPEDDTETFETFSQWLYNDELDEIKIDKERPWNEPLLGRIKLILFAEKYCIDFLADYAIDTILLASEDGVKETSYSPLWKSYKWYTIYITGLGL